MASPALVPLREDKISRYEDTWGTSSTTIACNGPFTVKTFESGSSLVLERNTGYYRTSENQADDKVVKPYRIVVDYGKGEGKQIELYDEKFIAYNGEIAFDSRVDLAKKAEKTDIPSVYSMMFNQKNETLAKADVRRALSLAIDREALAEIAVFAKPATGFVPYGVNDAKEGKSFRKVGGDIISATANVDEAKQLIKSAGADGAEISITYKRGDLDTALVTNIKEAWEAIGLKVELVAYGPNQFAEKYKLGEYDVIACDIQAMSTDAYSVLAPYAALFSGNAMDMASGNYDPIPHVTGFKSSPARRVPS